uniref:uncharacterized protein LOC124069440 n=1 Tax=Scatophagus argus TaxID=75038 RepID=UPI001ED7D865|nr:uncharacterized protein LOC124069440 [Scatophagus argus]
MAFNAPPVEEHLLAGISQPLSSTDVTASDSGAGGFFRPSNDGTERLAAERPEENRVINSAPLLPDYEEELDVVGVDDDDVLQVAELQGADGGDIPVRPSAQRPEDNKINTPPLLPDYEEEDEEIDVVGLDDLLHPAEPHRDLGVDQVSFDRPQSRGGEERGELLNDNEALNARSPSPPQQDPAAEGPLYGHIPHGDPFAPPFLAPPAFIKAPPEMDNAWEAEDNRTETPVENIGPLELLSSDSSVEDDAELSTSGLKSSTRRSREEDDEEQATTKWPRWSDDSDSD